MSSNLNLMHIPTPLVSPNCNAHTYLGIFVYKDQNFPTGLAMGFPTTFLRENGREWGEMGNTCGKKGIAPGPQRPGMLG